jgi:glycosyltransferase involved in cell wall biosynthesis/SAM-dependent methyltransferase
LNISVVIPARDAAATLAETLESLVGQTFRRWEAIVVDDGSTDQTPEIAGEFAMRDSRIRITRQPAGGESAARNRGIELSRFDWLLFLDADDLILPAHLQLLTDRISKAPHLDAVHCGWARLAPDGRLSDDRYGPDLEDLFDNLARFCTFAIHTCLVKRSLVEGVGRFDTSLRTCPDWDLWQRVARAGARFGSLAEVLALYRMRPNSAGVNAAQILADGLAVIERGHSADPRVPSPNPAHVNGSPKTGLARAKLTFACWPAGLVLGNGGDPRFVLDTIKGEREPELDPDAIVPILFEACLLPQCRTLDEWPSVWPNAKNVLDRFLRALEFQATAVQLAERVQRRLEDAVAMRARLVTNGSRRPRKLRATADRKGFEMQQETLISVVMVFFNAENFICEAIDSVLAQTYQPWELLLINDGSADASREIALGYAKKWPDKIRFLEHSKGDNRGISASRNVGIANAKGEYIAFLDADDAWLPHKLERQVAIMESQPGAGMVYGPSQYWYSWTGLPQDMKRDRVPDLGVPADTLFQPGRLLTLLYPLGKAAAPCPSALLIRRKIFDQIGGFEETFVGDYQLYEDQPFLAKIYLHEHVFVSSECWDRYRIHPDSCVSRVTKAGRYDAVRLFFLNWLQNYFSTAKVKDAEVWAALQNARDQYCSHIRQGNWWLRIGASNQASLEFQPDNPDMVRIAIRKAATGISSDIQLSERRLTSKANHRYVVNFLARADCSRTIFVGFGKARAPWNNLGFYTKIELTSEWESFEADFIATENDDDARIHFDVGDSNIPVEFSSLTLCSLSEGKCVKPTVLAGAISQKAHRRVLNESPVQIGEMQFGALRRMAPISREWGFDRGLPIDRYYIEQFLGRHKDDVQGRVLEVGDNSYTRKFGTRRVSISDVLHVKEGNPQATLVGDLTGADHIPSDTFDCIILTQTLQLIYDVRSAIKTVYRILKPGGVLLATFPGISQTYDNEWRESWCWSFTPVSARRLFQEVFLPINLSVEHYGNVLAAISFLHGLATEELTPQELDHYEAGYDITIAVRGIKPEKNTLGLIQ